MSKMQAARSRSSSVISKMVVDSPNTTFNHYYNNNISDRYLNSLNENEIEIKKSKCKYQENVGLLDKENVRKSHNTQKMNNQIEFLKIENRKLRNMLSEQVSVEDYKKLKQLKNQTQKKLQQEITAKQQLLVTLKKLKQQNTINLEELNKQRCLIVEFESKYSKLQQDFEKKQKSFNQSIEQLSQNHKNLSISHKQIYESLVESKKQNEKLKQQHLHITYSKQNQKIIEQQTQEYQKTINQYIFKINEWQNKYNEIQIKYFKFQKQNDQYKIAKDQAQSECAQYKQRLQEESIIFQKQQEKWVSKIKSLEAEKRKLENQKANLGYEKEMVINKLKKEKENQVEQNKLVQQKFILLKQEHTQQITKLHELLTLCETNIKKEKANNLQNEEKLRKYQQQISNLQKQISKLSNTNSLLESRVVESADKKNSRLENLEKEIKQKNQQIDVLKDLAKSKEVRKKAEMQKVSKIFNDQLEEVRKEFKQFAKSKQQCINYYKNQLKQLEIGVLQKDVKYENLLRQKQRLQVVMIQKQRQYNTKIDELQKQNIESKWQHQIFSDQIHDLSQQVCKFQQELDSKEILIENKQKKIAEAILKIQQKQNIVSIHLQNLNKSNLEYTLLTRENNRLRNCLEQASLQLVSSRQEHQKELQQTKTKHLREITGLSQKLTTSKYQYDAEILNKSIVSDHLGRTLSQLNSTKDQLSRKQNQLIQKDKQIQKMRQNFNQTTEDLQQKNITLEMYQYQISNNKKTIETYQQQYQQLSQKYNQLESTGRVLQQKYQQLENRYYTVTEDKRTIDTELQKLSFNMNSSKIQFEQQTKLNQQQNIHLMKRIQELECQLHDKNCEIDQFKQQIVTSQSNLKKITQQLPYLLSKIEQKNAIIQEMTRVYDQDSAEMQKYRYEIEQSRRHLQREQKDRGKLENTLKEISTQKIQKQKQCNRLSLEIGNFRNSLQHYLKEYELLRCQQQSDSIRYQNIKSEYQLKLNQLEETKIRLRVLESENTNIRQIFNSEIEKRKRMIEDLVKEKKIIAFQLEKLKLGR